MNAQNIAATVKAAVGRRRDYFVEMVVSLARIETPSEDADAQIPLMALLTEKLEALDYQTKHLPGVASGGMLYAAPRRRIRNQPVQLLLGHCDTVWPLGTLEEMPVDVREDCLYGPGVYDMKAGLAQILLALEVLAELDVQPSVTPVVLVNSDEEIGSRESVDTIRQLARTADRTLVLEPSLGPEGMLKTARKGIGRFTVSITGSAAHAGLDPGKGASAILELSHVIQYLHGLNDVERGISVNVGVIEGGNRPNVVAAASQALVDVRVRTQEDVKYIEEKIHQLEAEVPGVTLKISGRIGRPPMERTPRNKALWNVAHSAGMALGLDLEQAEAGGGSDGNHASLLSATLDGLGPVGDGAHARHEHINIDASVDRVALLAMLLLADPVDTEDGAVHPGQTADLFQH
jgi:glutamate carboxypeptidase